MLSSICKAFNCTPDEAKRLDWSEVQEILDFRAVEAAVEAFRNKDLGKDGFEALADLFNEMQAAQLGLYVEEASQDSAINELIAQLEQDRSELEDG